MTVRIQQIINRYRANIYSLQRARRELVVLGYMPDEADELLASRPPEKAPLENSHAGVSSESENQT